MNYLRIFGPDDSVVRELVNVGLVEVFPSGALHVTLADADEPGARLTEVHVAPGFWEITERWSGEPPFYIDGDDTCPACPAEHDPEQPPAKPIDPRQSTPPATWPTVAPDEPPAGSHLAAVRELRPAPAPRGPLDMPNGLRLEHAMKVHCACDELRCPVVLNPATDAEREQVAASMRTPDRVLVADPEPLQRCTRRVGHPDDAMGHVWAEGAWPYGAAEHHQGCPRWPARYNAPADPCGHVVDGLPCLRPAGHSDDHTLDMAEALRTSPAGVAAVLASHGMFGAAAAVAEAVATVNPTGWEYSRDLTDPDPEPAPVPDGATGHQVGRMACTVDGPHGSDLRCERPAGHEDTHSAYRGGDLIHW